ncbi:MAG: ABC transporter ATP-binding protein [Pseudomonadota bacterium]|nr:ABC transporter ATP-binding protein [Pseudomonadota bacterium]
MPELMREPNAEQTRDATPLLAARQLVRRYGDKTAVDRVDLTVSRGNVLGLLGPNGAGKSTTLEMLAGQLAPEAGSIQINGEDMLANPHRALMQVGYLPDQPPLYPELRVDEFLAYCAALHRLAPALRHTRCQAVKQACGLADHGGRIIRHLSRGYQQRLGIAQAIIHDPSLLILDEPTVALDPLELASLRSLIAELAQNRGILLSTHILSEVEAICSHVAVIRHGRIVFFGSLQDLKSSGEGRWHLRFGQRPDLNRMSPADMPERIWLREDGRIELHGSPETLDAFIAASIRQGWKLRELTPAGVSLEQRFRDLTQAPGTGVNRT